MTYIIHANGLDLICLNILNDANHISNPCGKCHLGDKCNNHTNNDKIYCGKCHFSNTRAKCEIWPRYATIYCGYCHFYDKSWCPEHIDPDKIYCQKHILLA